MHIINKIAVLLLALILQVSTFAPAVFAEDVPYKFTIPDAPYKYTYPDAPYRYTYPQAPYRYTYPDGPYVFSIPDTPYVYSRPYAPYKYTRPDAPYRYSRLTQPYKFTIPTQPYKYTIPGAPYRYTDPDGNLYEDDVVYSTPYCDTYEHPAERYILMLSQAGVIEGYDDGCFHPEDPVTRAEMVKMVIKAAQIQPISEEYITDLYFADLDDWQAPHTNAAYSMGIADGFIDPYTGQSVFDPNRNVNRAEGVKLTLAAFGIQPGDVQVSSFIDVHGWMVPWIEVAYSIGIIDMTSDGKFYPEAAMNRGTAAIVIGRMMEFESGYLN